MRIKDLNGIIKDWFDLSSWENPLAMFKTTNKYELDLFTGKHNWEDEDSITKLLRTKRDFFLSRIKKLKGKKRDFEKAKISAHLGKEKIEIIYKGKKFVNEKIWG